MATIQQRGESWRVFWRLGGRGGVYQTTTWPDRATATRASSLAKAHSHQITAEDLYAAILGRHSESDAQRPTLREWCAVWLDSKTRITSGVRRTYERQLATRILPILGDMRIADIRPTDVGRLINSLRESGMSTATATRYYAVLHGAFSGAIAEGLRSDNPCARSDFVRDQAAEDDEGREKRVYLTPRAYELFLMAFKPADRLFVRLLASTGARWSEATALRAGDLLPLGSWDPDPGEWMPNGGPRLRIARAWKLDGDNQRYVGTPKARQRRTIGIDDELHAMLSRMVEGRDDEALMFTNPRGGVIDYSVYIKSVWRPALAAARRCVKHPPADRAERRPRAEGRCGDFGGRSGKSGFGPCSRSVVRDTTRCSYHSGPAKLAVSTCGCPDVLQEAVTPHDLRHTHAAWLFADASVPPLAISRRLGHSTLMTTSEIYGGLMPSADKAAVGAIAAVMRRVGGSSPS